MRDQYDESQKLKRGKIAHQTLFLFSAVILVNAGIRQFYGVWAEPFAEALILICLPSLFFSTQAIWCNAWLIRRQSARKALLMCAVTSLASLAVILQAILSDTYRPVEDGLLTNANSTTVLFLYFSWLGFALFMRMKCDGKNGE